MRHNSWPKYMTEAKHASLAAMPRVMHVITSLHTGGAESMLTSLALASLSKGQEIHVVSLMSGGANYEHLSRGGVPVMHLGLARGQWNPLALWRLARLIRRLRPSVVQSWMYHADLAATLGLALSGRRRRTRLYWGVRCSDMDLGRYGPGLKAVIGFCARLSFLPDAVIANSRAGKNVHERLGYRPREFLVYDNGIDTERFRPDPETRARIRAELGIPPDEMLLIQVARMDPMKDYDCFLAALRRLPGIRAIAVGEGTQQLDDLPGLIRLGPRRDVPALLAASDIIVSSSAFGEGFSNAIAEGMACGLPAVATTVGDAARIVGDAGILVPPRDPQALASAIMALARKSPTERVVMGQAARHRIVEQFSLERAVSRFGALYMMQDKANASRDDG